MQSRRVTGGIALLTLAGSTGVIGVTEAQAAAFNVQLETSARLAYEAPAGTTNNVTFSQSGSNVIVDDIVPLTAGPGCEHSPAADLTRVSCAGADVTLIVADLLDGHDKATKTAPQMSMIDGGTGNDIISGGPSTLGFAINWLTGGDGHDTLTGGANRDILKGDAGSDVMKGGGGLDDSVTYSGETADVIADLDGVKDDGIADEDTIGTDVEGLTGGQGDDRLTGSDVANNLSGSGGDDTLTGGDGDDYLSGGEGTFDLLRGGNGADRMAGGNGSADQVSYSGVVGAVTADLDGAVGDDGVGGAAEGDSIDDDVENLTGGSGSDTLTGNASANHLNGGVMFLLPGGSEISGNDTLNGLAGNDTLVGRRGADVMNGGLGVDTVSYSERSTLVVVDLDGVADDGGVDGGTSEGDNALSVENITGGAGNDILTGNSAANLFFGNAGSDDLNGLGGDDRLWGGVGLDSLDGGDHVSGDMCEDWGVDAMVRCEFPDPPQ